jgi:hypothetical protein
MKVTQENEQLTQENADANNALGKALKRISELEKRLKSPQLLSETNPNRFFSVYSSPVGPGNTDPRATYTTNNDEKEERENKLYTVNLS